MKFYSGFSLRNEAHFFGDSLADTDYTVAGFSYGAIKAAEHARDAHERIDLLQLFSPAFFQTKPEKFKRLQMMGYKKDKSAYLKQFTEHCFVPYAVDERLEHTETSADELHELLYYEWKPELLGEIAERGIRIEVYLGGSDAIIDAEGAREFFKPFATVYFIKRANHFLQSIA